MKYMVGMKILNCFEIEAGDEEEAENKARALGIYEVLDDADFEITYIEEVTP